MTVHRIRAARAPAPGEVVVVELEMNGDVLEEKLHPRFLPRRARGADLHRYDTPLTWTHIFCDQMLTVNQESFKGPLEGRR